MSTSPLFNRIALIGFGLIGGSVIVAPTGEIAAQALGEDDELVLANLDLDLGDYIRRTVFNFAKHRRVEHYGLITERTMGFYGAYVDMDELRAEGDRMVGDDIAEDGIRYLQAINFKDRARVDLVAAE